MFNIKRQRKWPKRGNASLSPHKIIFLEISKEDANKNKIAYRALFITN
jgi:hypothetical protein